MIDKVGFGEVVNGYLFGIAAIIGLIINFMIVSIVPRRLLSSVSYSIMFLLYLFLIFLKVSDDCFECANRYIQIVCLMIGFLFLNMLTSIIYIHFVEFYPVSIRNIG